MSDILNNKDGENFKVDIGDSDYTENTPVSEESNRSSKLELGLEKDFFSEFSNYDDEDNIGDKKPKNISSENNKEAKQVKVKRDLRLLTKSIVVIIILAVAVSASLFCFKVANDVLGMIPQGEIVVVDLPKNATVDDVKVALYENNVVKYPWLFDFYVNLRYKNIKFKQGQVVFDTSKYSGYDNVISQVRYSASTDVVTVTVPEGYTVLQISEMLEDKGVCSASSFMAAVKLANFDEYDFVRAINSDDKYLSLEGYVFPDTYEFYKNDDATNVLKKFLDNFSQRFTEEMITRANEMGYSIDDVVTLASIVQKEAGDSSQMKKISSVFKNRLNNSSVSLGKLESDVTIFYVEENIKPYVSEEESENFSSAYNTYKCKGIPAGAVSNPGLDAINAVLYPEETNYYFFVTDVLGNYYYAETLEEHNINVKIAFSVGDGG